MILLLRLATKQGEIVLDPFDDDEEEAQRVIRVSKVVKESDPFDGQLKKDGNEGAEEL